MFRKLILLVVVIIFCKLSIGQTIDSLKLNDAEIPAGYTKLEKLICQTPHASSVYDQSEMFESMLGKVVKKEFQSFSKQNDKGGILYFQFDKEFTGQNFLESLLWGDAQKPSASEPDEYMAKGNILIIWSFKLKSEIKQVSMAKIQRIFGQ